MGLTKPLEMLKGALEPSGLPARQTGLPMFQSLLRQSWFPGSLQVAFTLAIVVLAYLGLQPVRRAETNPALAVIWLLWWPILPFTVPFLGRLWCALCPAGALGDWAQKCVPGSRPMAPSWVQKFGAWFALVGIVATGLAFLAFALETNGPLTVAFLAIISAGAVILALPYKGRVWCRWFCPLGMMLGLYGRTGWVAVGPGPAGAGPATAAARTCPQFTSPISHRRRHDCILCGVCFKEGNPNEVVVQTELWPRLPDLPTLPGESSTEQAGRQARHRWQLPRLTLVEALAVTLLLGLLTVDSLRMTPLYLKYTTWAMSLIDNYRLGLTLGGLALMGLILTGQVVIAQLMGRHADRARLFGELSFILIPLVLALHLALSTQHLFAGGPSALQGIGIELGLLAAGHTPPADAYFVNLPMKVFQFLLLALGVGGMAYLSGRGKAGLDRGSLLPVWSAPALALGIIFWQPMSAAC